MKYIGNYDLFNGSHCFLSYFQVVLHGPLTRYTKLQVVHAPGMPGTFSPPPQVSAPDMHQGMCMTHVPWCMPGSLTSGFPLKSVAGKMFLAYAQPTILRIWQEAHGKSGLSISLASTWLYITNTHLSKESQLTVGSHTVWAYYSCNIQYVIQHGFDKMTHTL